MNWLAGLFAEKNSFSIQNVEMLTLVVAFLFGSFKIAKFSGIFGALLLAWVSILGVYVACYQVSPYSFDLSRYIHFSKDSFRSLMAIWAVCIAAVAAPARTISLFPWVGIASSLILLTHPVSFLQCASWDASFLAVLLPLYWRKEFKWKWLILIPLAAIIKSGSSTAFLAVGLSVWSHFRSMKAAALSLVLGGLALLAWPLNHSIWETSGRLEVWSAAWSFFRDHGYWWAGFGTGSYAIHAETFYPVARWIYLHFEPGQVLFDSGSIGLSLYLLLYMSSLWWIRRNKELFSSLTVLGFTSLSHPMLRNMLVAFYSALLIKEARVRRFYG